MTPEGGGWEVMFREVGLCPLCVRCGPFVDGVPCADETVLYFERRILLYLI